MTEMCACKKHEFEFQFEDKFLTCPVCGSEYSVYMDMDEEDKELEIELTMIKDMTMFAS